LVLLFWQGGPTKLLGTLSSERHPAAHRDQAEDTLGVVPARARSAQRDTPLVAEGVEVGLITRLVICRIDHRHSRWEVPWADNINSNTQVSAGELRRELVRQGDSGGPVRQGRSALPRP
jgi:hypothetical protein